MNHLPSTPTTSVYSGSAFSCRHKYVPSIVVERGGAKIRLQGHSTYGAEDFYGDILFNFSGRRVRDPQSSFASIFREPEEVLIGWPDGSAPTFGIDVWGKLLETLVQRAAGGVLDVAICCQMGHGRTGTAMSALLIANGTSAAVAVDEVRAKHCKEAVETQVQVIYLQTLDEHYNGRISHVEIKPSMAARVHTYTPTSKEVPPRAAGFRHDLNDLSDIYEPVSNYPARIGPWEHIDSGSYYNESSGQWAEYEDFEALARSADVSVSALVEGHRSDARKERRGNERKAAKRKGKKTKRAAKNKELD